MGWEHDEGNADRDGAERDHKATEETYREDTSKMKPTSSDRKRRSPTVELLAYGPANDTEWQDDVSERYHVSTTHTPRYPNLAMTAAFL